MPVRIIPCLDIKDGRVVKGVHFVDLRDAGDPLEAARAYSEDGADEIVFLDITATVEDRRTMIDLAGRTAEAISCPLTVGGGIKTLDDVQDILDVGASKVSISSAAYRDPGLIRRAAREYGSKRIVVAIDADRNPDLPSGYEVYIDGGRTATGTDAIDFARQMTTLGAGEILPTSKATDGTKDGYDIELTRKIAEATELPVTASGGAGTLEHFYEAATEGKATGLLAASVFHYGELTVGQVKEYLREKSVETL